MDVFIAWVCLGGGAALIVISMVVVARLQARTRATEETDPES
jgi:hypothetical protein